MVVVKISGGHGNQLFQYSFGQYLAKLLKTKVLYDIQTNKILNDFTPRGFGLSSFDIKLEIATQDEIKSLKYFTNGFFERIERMIALKFPFYFNTYYVESSLHKIISYRKIKDNCYYEGYWQTYNYLSINETELRREISIKTNLSKENDDLKKMIINSDSISIHIRRGDYISIKKNNDVFEICSMEYYESAIRYIEKTHDCKLCFYVFSDDIEWARKNFKGDKFRFISGNQPADDIYLMSLCKHNIIANSTFSWWAAWLNSYSDKIVISPKLWYVGKLNKNIANLIPEKWIQM